MKFDASVEPAQPRAKGDAQITVRQVSGVTRLSRFYQAGSSKMMTPKASVSGLDCVLVNTAGGVTGGDAFSFTATAEADTRLTLTTQAAERAYKAQPGSTGAIQNQLRIEKDARIDWLPQETIFFEGASIMRRLEIDLHESATLLAVEPVILGRPAMGEKIHNLRYSDQWRVRKGGRLIFADAVRVVGDADQISNRLATLNGAGAYANLLYVSPEADAFLDPLRNLMNGFGGVSRIRPGVLAARLVAATGYELRRKLIPVMEHLRGCNLPKVWSL